MEILSENQNTDGEPVANGTPTDKVTTDEQQLPPVADSGGGGSNGDSLPIGYVDVLDPVNGTTG